MKSPTCLAFVSLLSIIGLNTTSAMASLPLTDLQGTYALVEKGSDPVCLNYLNNENYLSDPVLSLKMENSDMIATFSIEYANYSAPDEWDYSFVNVNGKARKKSWGPDSYWEAHTITTSSTWDGKTLKGTVKDRGSWAYISLGTKVRVTTIEALDENTIRYLGYWAYDWESDGELTTGCVFKRI